MSADHIDILDECMGCRKGWPKCRYQELARRMPVVGHIVPPALRDLYGGMVPCEPESAAWARMGMTP